MPTNQKKMEALLEILRCLSNEDSSISNALQMFFPIDDPRAKQLTPDWVLTYDDYKKYGFDKQAEVLYLLDRIE